MVSKLTSLGAIVLAAFLLLSGLPILLPDAGAEGWIKVDLGNPSPGYGGYGLYDVALGDGDRDGSTEVYVVSSGDSCVYQFTHRMQDHGWQCESLGAPPGAHYFANAVHVGDGDDDGQDEVYSCAASWNNSYYSNSLFEYSKSGDGWDISDMGAAGTIGLSMAIGDGDRDGRNEVYCADDDGHIYEYSKSGEWNRADIGYAPDYWYDGSYWVTPEMCGVAVADGDNDGKVEVYGAASDNHMYRFNRTDKAWTREDLGSAGPMGQNHFGFSGLVIGDADEDGRNELYGCGFTNGSVWRYDFNATTRSWDIGELVRTGSNGYRICMGDGDADGNVELYIGANNKELYQVGRDAATGQWSYDSVGAGKGPLQGIAIGSATGDARQLEVYAACQDGHLYQFYYDRAPPANPLVGSDTHPEPGKWYSERLVHVFWNDSGPDISGIDGYSYVWDNEASTVPDETKDCEESVLEAWSTRLWDGSWYFHIRSRDNSLNWNKTAATFGPICIDGGAPYNLKLTIEHGLEYFNGSLVQLSLSASDPGTGSGVAAMSFSNDGSRWSTWEDLAPTRDGWDLTATNHGGDCSDGPKLVHARVKDRAGNEVSEKNRTSDSIFLDRAAPEGLSITINDGARYTSSAGVSLGLAGRDPEPSSGLVAMKFSNNGRDWGEWTEWGDSAQWSLTGGAGGSDKEGWHDVYMMTRDRAWNLGGPVKSSIFLDRTPPSGLGLMMNNGSAFTNRSVVDLVIAAADSDTGSQLGELSLSNNANATGEWRPFSSTVSGWSLVSGAGGTDADGSKSVFLWVRDRTGNIGGPVSATIFLDRAPPVSASITINGGATLTNKRLVMLALSAHDPDPASSVKWMQFSGDGAEWSPWESFAPQEEYTLPEGDGRKTVLFRVRDAAGNLGEAASASIRLDTAPPVISGIRVLAKTDTSAVIAWSTDEEADSAVDYGTTVDHGSSKEDPAFVTAHSLCITGLSASTTYHFRVRSRDRAGNPPAVSGDDIFTTDAAPDTLPPAISDVRVLGLTDSLAVIGWTTNEPADSVLRWGRDSGYGATVRDGLFILQHDMTLRDLQPSTTYHFMIESTDSSGNGPSVSDDRSFTTLARPDTLPPVISGLKVTGVSDRIAVVSWETDEPSTGALEFGTTTGYGSSMADARLRLSHELTLTALTPSTTYHLRVGATDASGNGPAFSDDAQFTTAAAPDITSPSITGIRVENIGDSSALVLWETDEPADGQIEFGTSLSYGSSSVESTHVLSHGVVLAGLRANTSYHFRIRSSDPAGNTATSHDGTFRTTETASAPDLRPPVISGATVAGMTDVRAVVMWLTDELADSEVDFGTDAARGQKARDPGYCLVHSVVLEGLKPSTKYHLRVLSWDVAGNGPAAGPDMTFETDSTPDRTAPVISDVVVSEITEDSALVRWRTDEPALGSVEHGPAGALRLKVNSSKALINHSMRLSGLAPGTTYQFRITSTDPAGNPAIAVNGSFQTLDEGVQPSPPKPGGKPAAVIGGVPPWAVIAAVALLAMGLAGAMLYGRRSRRPGPPGPEDQDRLEVMVPAPEAVEVTWDPMPDGPMAPPPVELPPELATLDWSSLDAAGAVQAHSVPEPEPLLPEMVPMALSSMVAEATIDAGAVVELPESRYPTEPARARTVRCTRCGKRQPAPVGPFPARLTCPACGRSGRCNAPKASGPAT